MKGSLAEYTDCLSFLVQFTSFLSVGCVVVSSLPLLQMSPNASYLLYMEVIMLCFHEGDVTQLEKIVGR